MVRKKPNETMPGSMHHPRNSRFQPHSTRGFAYCLIPVLTILLATVLASGAAQAAGGNPPVDQDGRPLIRKLGTFDTTRFVENSLVLFKGKLYSFRWMGDEIASYFQFEEYDSGKKMPPFAKGYAYPQAFVAGDTVYVSSALSFRQEDMTKVWMHSSQDLVHWETREVLSEPGWFIFTSPICKAGNRYVMMHDVYAAPSEGRGGTFCRFSTSDDMVHWKMTPPECWFTRNGFAAGHFLAYSDGYFYNFYMGANNGYEMRVARSKDLIQWEDSPLNPVLRTSEEDRKLANPNFTEEQKKRIATMTNINNSDMCLIEYQGKVIIRYCTGDQATSPTGLAEAIYDGTEAQFLRGWFAAPAHTDTSNAIANGNFENPLLSGVEGGNGNVPNWVTSGGYNNIFKSTTWPVTGAGTPSQILIQSAGSSMSQALTGANRTFVPGAVYTLAVNIGSYDTTDTTFTMSLRHADTHTTVATLTTTGNVPLRTMQTAPVNLRYTATAADAGQTIEVCLTATTNLAYDNVTLVVALPDSDSDGPSPTSAAAKRSDPPQGSQK